MNKVVYNACYGGFSLSEEAANWLLEHGSDKITKGDFSTRFNMFYYKGERHDKLLIECVETLGSKLASGYCANLQIAVINGNKYRIDEYDGNETVIESNEEDWITIE